MHPWLYPGLIALGGNAKGSQIEAVAAVHWTGGAMACRLYFPPAQVGLVNVTSALNCVPRYTGVPSDWRFVTVYVPLGALFGVVDRTTNGVIDGIVQSMFESGMVFVKAPRPKAGSDGSRGVLIV